MNVSLSASWVGEEPLGPVKNGVHEMAREGFIRQAKLSEGGGRARPLGKDGMGVEAGLGSSEDWRGGMDDGVFVRAVCGESRTYGHEGGLRLYVLCGLPTLFVP